MAFESLPTLAEVGARRRLTSKGKTRKQLKARKDREDATKLEAFRDAVWLREETKMFGDDGTRFTYDSNIAACQHCGAGVMRSRLSDAPLTGDVHHRISRRHRATRYDPDNGVLLCNDLVNGCHGKAERHEIQV